jgi:DNA phosphorothioation-dependent restriction protein DptG
LDEDEPSRILLTIVDALPRPRPEKKVNFIQKKLQTVLPSCVKSNSSSSSDPVSLSFAPLSSELSDPKSVSESRRGFLDILPLRKSLPGLLGFSSDVVIDADLIFAGFRLFRTIGCSLMIFGDSIFG